MRREPLRKSREARKSARRTICDWRGKWISAEGIWQGKGCPYYSIDDKCVLCAKTQCAAFWVPRGANSRQFPLTSGCEGGRGGGGGCAWRSASAWLAISSASVATTGERAWWLSGSRRRIWWPAPRTRSANRGPGRRTMKWPEWQRPGQMRGDPKPFAPRHPLSRRQASEGAREDPAPKPRSLACFERRKPPLGAVFLVFDLHRALLGAG